MTETRSTPATVTAAMLLAIPAFIYLAGYPLLSARIDMGAIEFRVYAYDLLATIYSPAAKVESFVRGVQVETYGPNPITLK